MKIVINIKDEYIRSFKYVFFAISLILWISYVYFIQGWQIDSPTDKLYLLLASIFWIYMAVNLWANDVANNMGPAVWSKALTLTWAIIIAAIFEASGAILAGWDVVDTIKSWIINQDLIIDPIKSIAIMLATLFWAAIWINVATYVKAPVSATHAIIWALLGAWIMSQGLWIVYWDKVWMIAIAWVLAILMWGFIAVIILKSIHKNIFAQKDKWEAAKHWVPIYVWIMSGVFSLYILLKWLKPLLKSSEHLAHIITPASATFLWIEIGVLVYWLLILYYRKQKDSYFKDKKKFVNKLFNGPLIFAVALLSFAHWSNDVANAIWPVASIYDTIKNWSLSSEAVWIPTWIMLLWALSLAGWLAVFWWRLIKSVWRWITKLNQVRAFCIALSAAITVIIASGLWLPVSSTQIAIWAIFWIGLFREYEKRTNWKDKDYIDKTEIKKIVLSWIVTLPVAWIISALTYLVVIYFAA